MDNAQFERKEEKMLKWLEFFKQQPEPTALASYMEADAITKKADEARLSAIGARCVYRVPAADGQWRQIEGEIVNVTDTALVVKDRYFGVKHTIDPTWFVGYVWNRTAAALTVEASAAR